MVRPERVGIGKCRYNTDNLKERRAVVAGDAGGGVHGLEEL